MQLTEEQKSNLVTALNEYKKALAHMDHHTKHIQEKLNKLKTCLGTTTGDGPRIMTEAITALGEAYLNDLSR